MNPRLMAHCGAWLFAVVPGFLLLFPACGSSSEVALLAAPDAGGTHEAASAVDSQSPYDDVSVVDGHVPPEAASAVDGHVPQEAASAVDGHVPREAASVVDSQAPYDDVSVADAEAQPDGAPPKRKTHQGCAEAAGTVCIGLSEVECGMKSFCTFQYGQCLPKGAGCREAQGADECHKTSGLCVFEGDSMLDPGSKVECRDRCVLHADSRACEGEALCVWNKGLQVCLLKSANVCQGIESEAACPTDSCQWTPESCSPAMPCLNHKWKEVCVADPACTWYDFAATGLCSSRCDVLGTPSDCDLEPACEWSAENYICRGKGEAACYTTDMKACASNPKCTVRGSCQPQLVCGYLSRAECANHPECQALGCEHRCSLKRARAACIDDTACAWIDVTYEATQRCTTACHEGAR